MFDEEASQRAFQDVHRVWVEPEILRRRERGQVPEGFRIYKVLILLPADSPPIVQFNEEVGWSGIARLAPSASLRKGDTVYLAQLDRVETVKPPEVDGKRVAFIYLFLADRKWNLVFDATPNHPKGVSVGLEAGEWRLGKVIAAHLNHEMAQRAVGFHSSVENETRKIGLWAAPVLVPYPLSAISQKCAEGDLAGATSILVEHCSPDFLAERVSQWDSDDVFRTRAELFQQALWAHREGKFMLSVHTLMPQIEGVITDWACVKTAPKRVPRKHEKKIEMLRELLLNDGRLMALGRHLAKSLMSFLGVGGPMFENFDWFSPPEGPFPNRHVVGHGKFVGSNFTAEMSIKVFLLLDTLHYLFNADREE